MATSATKLAPKAAPQAGAAAENASAAPGKSMKKMFIILAAAVLLLACGGAAAWYFLGHGHEAAPGGAKKHEPARPPVFATLDPFTVNLQPENGDQFLQTAITLQVADQAQVDQVKLYMPIVRNRILVLLSGKKASEISTAEGKKKLGDEIIALLRQPFAADGAPPEVSSVLFTSFVIQ